MKNIIKINLDFYFIAGKGFKQLSNQEFFVVIWHKGSCGIFRFLVILMAQKHGPRKNVIFWEFCSEKNKLNKLLCKFSAKE